MSFWSAARQQLFFQAESSPQHPISIPQTVSFQPRTSLLTDGDFDGLSCYYRTTVFVPQVNIPIYYSFVSPMIDAIKFHRVDR
jgi:hypothetical protein